ncbi:hypothetical protein CLU97_2889 [Chryseobacterium sp. 7]|nr:hypothetical protein CLU97_2889 [Chryseobacterium sp. 7]
MNHTMGSCIGNSSSGNIGKAGLILKYVILNW